MKNTYVMENDPDMLREYDFSNGVRGKYAERYREGCNIVLLDPDVAEVFHDAETINQILRPLAQMIRLERQKTGTMP